MENLTLERIAEMLSGCSHDMNRDAVWDDIIVHTFGIGDGKNDNVIVETCNDGSLFEVEIYFKGGSFVVYEDIDEARFARLLSQRYLTAQLLSRTKSTQ